MEKFKHKYVFYFYPRFDIATGKVTKGLFRFFGRVSDGKAVAKNLCRRYDHEKLF